MEACLDRRLPLPRPRRPLLDDRAPARRSARSSRTPACSRCSASAPRRARRTCSPPRPSPSWRRGRVAARRRPAGATSTRPTGETLPLRAADPARRGDAGPGRDPRRRAGRARAAHRRRRGRLRRADRDRHRPSTRSTPRCSPSRSSFGCREASFRLSLPPAVEARLRELAERRRRRRDRPGHGRRRHRLRPSTVSVHLVEAERRRPHGARALGHPAARGLGPRRRHRLHRDPDRGGGPAARPRRARRAAARCRPSSASTRELCSPSSRRAESRFDIQAMRPRRSQREGWRPDRGQGGGVPGRADRGRCARARRARPRRADPEGRGGGLGDRRLRLRGAGRADRRHAPRTCSPRPTWCSASRSRSRRRSSCSAPRDPLHLPAPGAGSRADRGPRARPARPASPTRPSRTRRAGCRCWRR